MNGRRSIHGGWRNLLLAAFFVVPAAHRQEAAHSAPGHAGGSEEVIAGSPPIFAKENL
jgi:hypothetical protein